MKTPRLLFAALVLALGCQRPAPTTDTATATADAAACIDPSKIKTDAICTMQYDPVCGCDGKTYSNDCVASNAGVRTYTKGPCPEAKPK